MFCPKCRYEYRDDIKVCPDCKCELTEKLEETEKELEYTSKLCKIYTAADDFEADIIVLKLKAEGIYAMKKYRGSDDYNRILLGRTILGVDVYVADFDEEEAFEIVKS